MKYLSTKEFAKRTGSTPRQLQWWDERSILKPAGGLSLGRGARQYATSQIRIAKRLAVVSKHVENLSVAWDLAHLKWTEVRIIASPTIVGKVLVLPRKN